MSQADEDARLAGALVALGFPGDHAYFAESRAAALERYATDASFRRLATAFARGLGVVLVEVTAPHRDSLRSAGGEVILAAEKGTPFAPLVETLLPGNVTNDDRRRQVAVLALLAAVAEVFPTEDSLAEVDESREVFPAEVVQLLVSRAEEVSREPEPATTATMTAASGRDADLRRAFAVVRDLQPSVPTKKAGREAAFGLEGIVTSVLRDLAEKGLFRESTGSSRPGDRVAFRPAPSLAAHVRHLLDREAVYDALDGLRECTERGRQRLSTENRAAAGRR